MKTDEPGVDQQNDSAISFRGLGQYFLLRDKSGARAVEALHDVTLQIRKHEFVAIVGPSGCGKTTLLNIAAGLVKPQFGEVKVNGKTPRSGQKDVAYMLARDALLPWRTSVRNVEYGLELSGVGKKERRARAGELLAEVGLAGYENAYRSQLSHGMRQRVALARTFALKSSILLMDEPFGALDSHLKIQLGELLLRLWEQDKRSVMFVTHDLHEAIALADRVIVMRPKPGHIAADIPIPLPRPRDLNSLQVNAEYHDLYQHIWSVMGNV
ncbi:ABC transporter ATP-binding protein [Paenarthrobacter sp. NPDC056912]|uniref:ABC transporter ATP-binding protein n=1 Tax=Paenarthrobacter sp. NPDC056912 TaxID=3345965 RepID=UPI00366C3483